MVIEKANALVEHKRDVAIARTITRLARAYNARCPPPEKSLGRRGFHALQRPKRLFGAASNVGRSGSPDHRDRVIDTGSRMDDVSREFKGPATWDPPRPQAHGQGVFPAIDLNSRAPEGRAL